jgi:hypothetical protein
MRTGGVIGSGGRFGKAGRIAAVGEFEILSFAPRIDVAPVQGLDSRGCILCRNQHNYETGEKALCHNGLLLFLTASALISTVSE